MEWQLVNNLLCGPYTCRLTDRFCHLPAFSCINANLCGCFTKLLFRLNSFVARSPGFVEKIFETHNFKSPENTVRTTGPTNKTGCALTSIWTLLNFIFSEEFVHQLFCFYARLMQLHLQQVTKDLCYCRGNEKSVGRLLYLCPSGPLPFIMNRPT